MATDALRRKKNLIICTATLVTRAAIRGGLDKVTVFPLAVPFPAMYNVEKNSRMSLSTTRRAVRMPHQRQTSHCGPAHKQLSELLRKNTKEENFP